MGEVPHVRHGLPAPLNPVCPEPFANWRAYEPTPARHIANAPYA